MKKKLLCLILAAISAFSFAACATPDIRVAFDEILPFATVNNYEKSTYKVEKFTRAPSGSTNVDDKLIASGTYVTELTGASDSKSYEVKTSFSVTYTDIDEAKDYVSKDSFYDNRGLTDTITSVVRFNDGMAPIYSEKKFTCAPRPEGSLQMTSYSYTVDYITNKAEIVRGEDKRNFDLAGGTKYDNEQLMYIVRAMSSTKAGGTGDFYLVNPYDMFLTNNYFRYTVRNTCDKATIPYTLPEAMSDARFLLKRKDKETDVESDKNEQGVYSVNCTQVSLSLTTATPGPAIKMLISEPGVSFKERKNFGSNNDTVIATNKIIVSMRYLEYDVANAREKFSTLYSLSDYTTIKS